MRQLILRIFAAVSMLVALLQAMPALASTMTPNLPRTMAQTSPTTVRPGLAGTPIFTDHRTHHRRRTARTDHELVLKAWANIRTVPTTVGNRPVAHYVWGSRFTVLHRITYGQHPYGPDSSNHWLKIASGRYRGDFVWAEGIVDPHGSRSPPVLARTATRVQIHRYYRPARRYHTYWRHHTYRRHRFRYHSYTSTRRYYGGGTLSCYGLEALWRSAGGSAWAAVTAASIAIAESGGQQYAHSPTNDYGYWQINGSHGPGLATYDAYGNARAAILISGNGTNWSAWTTYRTGAYRGRC